MYESSIDKPRIGFVRQVARKSFEQCNQAFPEGYPTDIQKALALVLPGYCTMELENLPPGKSAIVSIEDKCIGINRNHPNVRKRFSIAHEMGHILLDHPSDVFDPSGIADEVFETEANAFAAEFLVPLASLKAEFSKCRNYKELAKKFIVSEESMYYRFKDAKLLSQIL